MGIREFVTIACLLSYFPAFFTWLSLEAAGQHATRRRSNAPETSPLVIYSQLNSTVAIPAKFV